MNLIKAIIELFKKKDNQKPELDYQGAPFYNPKLSLSEGEVMIGNHMIAKFRSPFTIEHYDSCNLFFPKHNGKYLKAYGEYYIEQDDILMASYFDSESKAVNFCKMCDIFFKSRKIIDVTI